MYFRHRIFAIVILIAGCFASAPAPAGAAPPPETSLLPHRTLRICEDDAQWPPFLYYGRTGDSADRHVVGVSVDVLNRILGPKGITYEVDFVPWKRCQAMLVVGSYDLAANASYSDERARTYRLSQPYYWLHSYYYYSRRQHPQGLKVDSLADLKHHRVCGLLGDNYATYGLQPADMDLLPHSYTQMIEKLHLGRCDLFIEKREIIAGFVATDPAMARAVNDPDLVGVPMDFVPATPFHFMVSPAPSWGPALVEVLNDGIADLQQSGELSRIMDRYIR